MSDDGVYVVTIDSVNAKVNSLGVDMIAQFDEVLQEIETNPAIKSAVLISGKVGSWVAGADIGMIEACKTAETATTLSHGSQRQLTRLENSKKPIVAAISGVCLGGGLELALACHYRIATKEKRTQLGLPEVLLGLLPGSGGTQRLPKLTSIPIALDLVLTGKALQAEKAKKLGIVDLLVSPLGPGVQSAPANTLEYLETVAVQVARDIADGTLKIDRSKQGLVEKLTEFAFGFDVVKNKVFEKAREEVIKISGGLYPAPLKVSV